MGPKFKPNYPNFKTQMSQTLSVICLTVHCTMFCVFRLYNEQGFLGQLSFEIQGLHRTCSSDNYVVCVFSQSVNFSHNMHRSFLYQMSDFGFSFTDIQTFYSPVITSSNYASY